MKRWIIGIVGAFWVISGSAMSIPIGPGPHENTDVTLLKLSNDSLARSAREELKRGILNLGHDSTTLRNGSYVIEVPLLQGGLVQLQTSRWLTSQEREAIAVLLGSNLPLDIRINVEDSK